MEVRWRTRAWRESICPVHLVMEQTIPTRKLVPRAEMVENLILVSWDTTREDCRVPDMVPIPKIVLFVSMEEILIIAKIRIPTAPARFARGGPI